MLINEFLNSANKKYVKMCFLSCYISPNVISSALPLDSQNLKYSLTGLYRRSLWIPGIDDREESLVRNSRGAAIVRDPGSGSQSVSCVLWWKQILSWKKKDCVACVFAKCGLQRIKQISLQDFSETFPS